MALCVFCGSSIGASPRYAEAARALGHAMAQRGTTLVYGGGHVGLMGVIADAVLADGGKVVGVIPQELVARELGHSGLTELRVVATMHERKAMMADLSDGFIALPGGAGTLEEIFEQWTWAQLGIHSKPCALLDVDGYFDPLRRMVEAMVAERFLAAEHAAIFRFEEDISTLLDGLLSTSAPPVRWATLAPAPKP